MKTHKCALCDKEFQTKSGLHAHFYNIHGHKGIKCNVCQQSFLYPSQLTSHKKSVHENKNHKCKSCENTFSYSGVLKRHINRYWIKRLSLFGGKWKSQISQIDIGINDYIHKDHKNQIGLVFQLFVYILQQFKWNLLKKQVL